MKKLIFSTITIFCMLSSALAQTTVLERWTYTGVPAGLLSTALSEEGTGSSFGGNSAFLRVVNGGLALFTSFNAPNEGWEGGVSHSSYAGSTTGIYEISYQVIGAAFYSTASGKAEFSIGLRSLASGIDDCKITFQYSDSTFNLLVSDESGIKSPVQIGSEGFINNVSVRVLYNLDSKGTVGSLRAYYKQGTTQEIEIYPGELVLHPDFTIDEFRLEVPTRTDGNSWAPESIVSFDNLYLKKIEATPLLTFVSKGISFIEDKGVLPGNTYEPGDILQIVTTNKNETVITVNDVSTSLYADPTAFSITSLSSNTYPSLVPAEIYTGVYQVEVLDGAVDGTNNVFTITNRIDSPSLTAPLIFTDTIK